jgi:hypothetical protein
MQPNFTSIRMHIKDIDARYGFCFVDAFSLRRRRR